VSDRSVKARGYESIEDFDMRAVLDFWLLQTGPDK